MRVMRDDYMRGYRCTVFSKKAYHAIHLDISSNIWIRSRFKSSCINRSLIACISLCCIINKTPLHIRNIIVWSISGIPIPKLDVNISSLLVRIGPFDWMPFWMQVFNSIAPIFPCLSSSLDINLSHFKDRDHGLCDVVPPLLTGSPLLCLVEKHVF